MCRDPPIGRFLEGERPQRAPEFACMEELGLFRVGGSNEPEDGVGNCRLCLL